MISILIVDDDENATLLYRGILEKAGFSVIVAGNGKEMGLVLEKIKPAIIILDVMLPDVNGLELCSCIKNDTAFAGVKILMVSGTQIRPAQVAMGIDTGADDYLTKPFDRKELLARVRNLLKLKQVEEELRDKNIQLQKLSGYLRDTQEEERKYLAAEVHEELGQLASALKMDIDWVAVTAGNLEKKEENRLSHASVTAELLINTIRKIASTLRPSTLDHLGLNASLESLCKEFAKRNNLQFSFHEAFDDTDLPATMSTELFRICQESLNNVISISRSTRMDVSISETNGRICLCIHADGNEVDMETKKDSSGIIMLQERAFAIGGELTIKNEKGKKKGISIRVIAHAVGQPE